MSTGFLEHGRVGQKRRTHAALVDAARGLLASGSTPTVEEAAEAAEVSRTTAYRYFPNQAALLAAVHPEIEAQSMRTRESDDPVVRVDDVVDELTRVIVEGEAHYRATLRLSLELAPAEAREALPLRQGRAIGWFQEALAPLADELGPEATEALAVALRSATGIEAFVWLTDVAGLDRERARCLMRWSARAMVQSALAGDLPPTR
jgi:AcrR family transcriptional regulator